MLSEINTPCNWHAINNLATGLLHINYGQHAIIYSLNLKPTLQFSVVVQLAYTE